jgi:hypothetical protein
METPVHQPPPVVEEEITSEQAAWSPWPEAPEGEDGGEERWGDEDADEAGDEQAEGGEGTSSSTVYQRGGTRLPTEPVTPAHKALITPDGES